MNILEKLKKGIILGDGGYLFALEKRGYVKAGPFTPEAVVKHPGVLEELHREFMRAGADVLQAFTFYATKEKLKTSKNQNIIKEINKNAVRIARKVARENKQKKVFVAGNLAMTWQYKPNDKLSEKKTRLAFREQVELQRSQKVDFFIAETLEYVGEAIIALEEIKKTGLPAMITFTIKENQRTKDNIDVVKACRILEEKGADIVGLNCQRDPKRILPVIKKVRRAVKCPVACQPVAYRCSEREKYFWVIKYKGRKAFPLELDALQLSRIDMADFAKEAKKIGVNYIGGCCGAEACHIRSMAEVLGKNGEAHKYSADLKLHPELGRMGKNAKSRLFRK